MISNKIGLELHDKVSKGASLTEQEKAQLDAWYTQIDSSEIITEKTKGQPSDMLRSQIEATLAQLLKATERLQRLAAENDIIKQENQAIKLKLAKKLGQKAA